MSKKKGTKKEIKFNTKSLRRILLCFVVLIFVVYSVITLVDIYSQLSKKRAELQEINDQIVIQEIKNDGMNDLYNYSDEEFSGYVEQIARDDLDYIRPGERVFVNVSGD